MPTITVTTTASPRWGESSSFNSTTDLKVGRSGSGYYYGYATFPAINKSWFIKSIKLRMNRIDTYSEKILMIGTNQSTAWADRGDSSSDFNWNLDVTVTSGTGSKTWDLTAYKDILQGYTGTFYMHVAHGSGSNSYCEFTGGTGSSSPRLIIEYEEATIAVTGNAFTVGTASTIVVGTANSGLTHTLKYSIGTLVNQVIQSNMTAGATVTPAWTPSTAVAQQIPNAIKDTVTLTLESYLNGELSSTLTFEYDMNIPDTSTYKPTVNTGTTTTAVVNPAGDTIGVYVQGRSKVLCTIAAAGAYGSTIAKYKMTVAGVQYSKILTDTDPTKLTSNVLNVTGTQNIALEVTDTRGRIGTATITISVNAYAPPTVTSFTVTRCLADGTVSNSGKNIKYTVSYSMSSIGGLNTPYSANIKFKTTGGVYSAPTTVTTAAYTGTNVTSWIGSDAITAGSYVVGITLFDRFNPSPSNGLLFEVELPSQAIALDVFNTGSGVAIDKTAELDGVFDVGCDSKFDGIVALGENGKYGNANLVYNPTLEVDASGWALSNANVTRDTSKSLNGCYTFKSAQSGLATDGWNGFYPNGANRVPCSVGDKISLSIYVWIDLASTFGATSNRVYLEFTAYNSSGTSVQSASTYFIPTTSHQGVWTRLALDGVVVTATDAFTCRIKPYVLRNGTAWFACPKIEKGILATEYASLHESNDIFNGVSTFNGESNFNDNATFNESATFNRQVSKTRFWLSEYVTDCIGVVASNEGGYELGGSGAGTRPTTADKNHPGVFSLNSTTTANQGMMLKLANGQGIHGGETFELIFRPVYGSGTTGKYGLHDSNSSSAPTIGAWFNMAALVLTGKVANGTTTITGAGSFTLTANTWYRAVMDIKSDRSLVTFTLYSEAGAVLWTDTVAGSNLPVETEPVYITSIVTNSGTTVRNMIDIDYMSFKANRVLAR